MLGFLVRARFLNKNKTRHDDAGESQPSGHKRQGRHLAADEALHKNQLEERRLFSGTNSLGEEEEGINFMENISLERINLQAAGITSSI
jgi:hypothetical protein